MTGTVRDAGSELPVPLARVGEGEWTSPTVVVADRDLVLHHLTVGVTGTVRVVGRLVNVETDDPVGGAMVSLLGMDRRVESNDEGVFVFDQLPPGFYEVAVLHRE